MVHPTDATAVGVTWAWEVSSVFSVNFFWVCLLSSRRAAASRRSCLFASLRQSCAARAHEKGKGKGAQMRVLKCSLMGCGWNAAREALLPSLCLLLLLLLLLRRGSETTVKRSINGGLALSQKCPGTHCSMLMFLKRRCP